MSHPILRECDYYVILEPSKAERFLTAEETLEWLEDWISKLEKLPKDLEEEPSNRSAAKRLLNTSCNLEITLGFTIQWFAIRLDQPNL